MNGPAKISPALVRVLKPVLTDVSHFSHAASGIRLRSYQRQAALAIVDSVQRDLGLTFVVLFPRQSGKNELQAQIEAYLLALLSVRQAEIVKVSPTWKPQSLNAMRRLERVLSHNLVIGSRWVKEQGYIYRAGGARIYFLSGAPVSNVVGATASTLLECDEAQDVLISKWDKDIAPMAASTHATRVFWGTAWTSSTLLAREMRLALQAEQQDGVRRVFRITAEQVAAEVPSYGSFVAEEIRKHGRQHPFVRTQYFSEEIDAEGGMFPSRRQALMRGDHPPQQQPAPGRLYALLLDVAGEDEGASGPGACAAALSNPGRDSTALTVVEVDLSPLEDPLVAAPLYRVVQRRLWTGDPHTLLYAQLGAMVESWEARYLVIDATGVGAGLASFLERLFPRRVIPFQFNTASKSRLGWDFLSLIESGRFRSYRPAAGEADPLDALFWQQLSACAMDVIPGPERRLRWGVPEGLHDPQTGEPVHDDLLLSSALCAVLDGLTWGRAASEVIAAPDPLQDLKEAY